METFFKEPIIDLTKQKSTLPVSKEVSHISELNKVIENYEQKMEKSKKEVKELKFVNNILQEDKKKQMLKQQQLQDEELKCKKHMSSSKSSLLKENKGIQISDKTKQKMIKLQEENRRGAMLICNLKEENKCLTARVEA